MKWLFSIEATNRKPGNIDIERGEGEGYVTQL